MWARLVCVVLVVSDALGAALALRVYEGEKHVLDQEVGASVLPRPADLQHNFVVKIEHPSGKDFSGRVVEQKEHHAFGGQPSDGQHDFQPSQTNQNTIGGEWKGISRFTEHQDQQHDLSQHQILGQVLQGLGQVNQVLGKTHEGVEQVNQIFGQVHLDYQKHNSFTNGDRETYTLGVEKKPEEHQNLVDAIQEVALENNAGTVSNDFIENKGTTNYDSSSNFKPLEDPNFSSLPKPLENLKENSQGVQTLTFTKELPVPYTIEVEKKVPFKVEFPVDRPYPVEQPTRYPVYVEKKVPYPVKEYVPQPYTAYKRVPYAVQVHVNKPYPIHVPKPYRVLVDKRVPYHVEKRVPYHVRGYVDKPYPLHVPLFRHIPYTVEKRVPLPVQVPVEKHYPVSVPKPYKVYLEKKVPHPANTPVYHQQEMGQQGGEVLEQLAKGDKVYQQHQRVQDDPYSVLMHNHQEQKVEGSRQSVGATDQGATMELQRYHQHPQWMENVPSPMHVAMYRPYEEEVEGSRQPVGTRDQGATMELQRYHQHPQWMENVPSPMRVAMYRPYEEEVEGSTQPTGTTERYYEHPQWKENVPFPMHVATYHPHEPRRQHIEGRGIQEPRAMALQLISGGDRRV